MPVATTVLCDCGKRVPMKSIEVRYSKSAKEAHVILILKPHESGKRNGKCFGVEHPFASWDLFG